MEHSKLLDVINTAPLLARSHVFMYLNFGTEDHGVTGDALYKHGLGLQYEIYKQSIWNIH